MNLFQIHRSLVSQKETTMMAVVRVFVILLAFPLATCLQLNVSNTLGSNMVLQRAPEQSRIWGTADPAGDKVRVTVATHGSPHELFHVDAGIADSGNWTATLPAVEAGGPYDIHISFASNPSQENEILLSEVMFGEVFFCSGQSNMVFSLWQNYNNASHIATADNPKYQALRLFTATPTGSSSPVPNLQRIEQTWTTANSSAVGNPVAFSYFSAVCWFHGKTLIDRDIYGNCSNGDPVPIGLVVSAYGGTRVHQWSSPDALSHCNQTSTSVSNRVGSDNSVHWNSMVVPYLPMRFRAVLWLQGESDVNPSDDPTKIDPQRGGAYYACAFVAMINDWRSKFDQPLPFTFVQLSPWVGHEAATSNDQLPAIRDAQLAALTLPNTCVSTAVDLGDTDPLVNPWDAVHFRNKAPLGPRLAACTAHLTLGSSGPSIYKAPTPKSPTVSGSSVTIAFISSAAGELVLNTTIKCPFSPTTNPVQYSKCSTFEIELDSAKWVAAADVHMSGSVVTVSAPTSGSITGIRYLWADWPVASLFGVSQDLVLPVLPFHFYNIHI